MSLRLTPHTRREFLAHTGRGLGLVAFAGFAPSFLVNSVMADAPKAEKDRSILVLIQLAGGNDGLNTVVHHENDHYHRLRPNLALRPAAGLHKVNDQVSLHPSMGALHRLLREGKLSVVQNVGYPNPNRSHFRSTEIWETASDADKNAYDGWMGRYFDADCSGKPGKDPLAIHGGSVMPQTFQAAGNKTSSAWAAASAAAPARAPSPPPAARRRRSCSSTSTPRSPAATPRPTRPTTTITCGTR